MDNNELIHQARELCEATKDAKARGYAIDSASLSWAIVQNTIPQLCDALEAAQKEIERLKMQCDINATSFFDMRNMQKEATARAEKAEAERDTYKAALQNWHEQEGAEL